MIDRQTFDMEDAGVSPVVGVILMVAVTVILAAVIGTFVLDLGSDVGQNAQAGVTFDEDAGNEVQVQLNSVQTADAIWVQADSDAYNEGTLDTEDVGDNIESAPDEANQYLLSRGPGDTGGVGSSVYVDTTGGSGQISVIGEVDGESSVIQTYSYE